jgi:hypothetical protein
MTYETNLALGRTEVEQWRRHLSPKWTYDMINGGATSVLPMHMLEMKNGLRPGMSSI